MTKHEFMERLTNALKRNGIEDISEIIDEYEQHLRSRWPMGSAKRKLRQSWAIHSSSQRNFAAMHQKGASRETRRCDSPALFYRGFGRGVFILLAAWDAVLAACSFGSLAVAAGLLGKLGTWQAIVPMPYGVATVFSAAMVTLCVLMAVGCVYFTAFFRQLIRVYGRFHRNTLSAAAGGPVLPPLAASPNFPPKARRRLRRVALVALCAFAVLTVWAILLAMITSGCLEFWHAWAGLAMRRNLRRSNHANHYSDGATSGIGLETARLLAQHGMRVIGVGRTEAHCAQAKQSILSSVPDAPSIFTLRFDAAARGAAPWALLAHDLEENSGGRLFALINNAGCARSWYRTTEDGYEQQICAQSSRGFSAHIHASSFSPARRRPGDHDRHPIS